jgi:hypothetical protein
MVVSLRSVATFLEFKVVHCSLTTVSVVQDNDLLHICVNMLKAAHSQTFKHNVTFRTLIEPVSS